MAVTASKLLDEHLPVIDVLITYKKGEIDRESWFPSPAIKSEMNRIKYHREGIKFKGPSTVIHPRSATIISIHILTINLYLSV